MRVVQSSWVEGGESGDRREWGRIGKESGNRQEWGGREREWE